MIQILSRISRILANYSSYVVIATALFTFLFPSSFAWVKGNTATVILGLIMLSMGLTLSTEDFRILFRRPIDIFIGACAQFLLMPTIAYVLVRLFHLPAELCHRSVAGRLLSGRSLLEHHVIPV